MTGLNAGARHRPVFIPTSRHVGLFFPPFPPKRRAERRAVRRARGAICCDTHGTTCLFQGTWLRVPVESTRRGRRLRQPTTEAGKRLRSARDDLIGLHLPAALRAGALTECLASPHCWVLGPPTSSAGRYPFTTLRGRTTRYAPHERPADATGPSHPAPRRQRNRRASRLERDWR
jgi:hypothetical protein